MSGEDPYTVLHGQLARVLCPVAEFPPCEKCEEAAYRVIAHHRAVRLLLVAFAEQRL